MIPVFDVTLLSTKIRELSAREFAYVMPPAPSRRTEAPKLGMVFDHIVMKPDLRRLWDFLKSYMSTEMPKWLKGAKQESFSSIYTLEANPSNQPVFIDDQTLFTGRGIPLKDWAIRHSVPYWHESFRDWLIENKVIPQTVFPFGLRQRYSPEMQLGLSVALDNVLASEDFSKKMEEIQEREEIIQWHDITERLQQAYREFLLGEGPGWYRKQILKRAEGGEWNLNAATLDWDDLVISSSALMDLNEDLQQHAVDTFSVWAEPVFDRFVEEVPGYYLHPTLGKGERTLRAGGYDVDFMDMPDLRYLGWMPVEDVPSFFDREFLGEDLGYSWVKGSGLR